MKTVNLKIHGLVQGVFFRKYTLEKAVELGILGTVRNHADGTVLVEATGEEETLGAFVSWCHKGPERARVSRVDIHELPLKKFTEFLIVR